MRWGIGAYGTELNDCLRGMPPYEKEEILASGSRGLLSNRIAYGFSKLKLGTFCIWKADNETATLSDFSPVTVGEMENLYLVNADMGPVGRYPFPLDFFKRSIKNQNMAWSMAFGVERYAEREDALEFLALMYEGSPEFFTTPF